MLHRSTFVTIPIVGADFMPLESWLRTTSFTTTRRITNVIFAIKLTSTKQILKNISANLTESFKIKLNKIRIFFLVKETWTQSL